LSSDFAAGSENAFDQKMCFYQVKINGKATWSPPTEKMTSGLWNLGEAPEGILDFQFTADPVAFKKEMIKLQREAAANEKTGGAAPGKNAPAATAKPTPPSKEIISETSLSRTDFTTDNFQRLSTILIGNL